MENNTSSENEQLYIAIEKYLQLIVIEFKEHLGKYKNLYSDLCGNTKEYFTLFEQMTTDYCEEINQTQSNFYEMISKMNSVADELPKIEEFYYKVKEMRLGLEKMHKLIKSNHNK